jgi:hypothetical protein
MNAEVVGIFMTVTHIARHRGLGILRVSIGASAATLNGFGRVFQ